ncbi:TRAP transporter substrate-binding protein [Desertibaculum subflavum]|uniref:TRAP transporter substrate-binding protein n=1 Tax=Desertibaculum subflavum TaxID=2268458 RepID=UPI000E66093E
MPGTRAMYRAGAIALATVFAFSSGAALAQDKKVRVSMQSAFASSLSVLGPAAQHYTKTVTRATGGSVDVKFFEPGSLVPPSQHFDAVAAGSLDAAWATPGYWTGKDIAFAVYSTIPFGPGLGEYIAWMKHAGGEKMMQELYKKYGIHSMVCGIISPEASGWFRKEIKSPEDLKGLKMRFFGLGANVMQKLGVSTQLLQAGEIFQALQLGTIDATEFSMPSMDLSLGFYQVAKHYYFPGWHQQATFSDVMWSQKKWGELSDLQKDQVDIACEATLNWELGLSENSQFAALNELKKKGVTIHRWSPEMLKTFEKAWIEVANEQREKSPEFKKAFDHLQKFRADYAIWKDIGYLQ